MRIPRFFVVLWLLLPAFNYAQSLGISGTISPSAAGAGATVALSGPTSAIATADSQGNYTFTGVSNGNYTVIVTKAGYTFSPSSQSLTVSTQSVAGINFTGAASSSSTVLVFDDEFNGTTLGTPWIALNRPGDASNSELQCYLPSNAAVSGGSLVLTAKVDSACSGYAYSSAMTQWNSYNFTYGTVEFRAKMAGGQGTWPAVWMLGSNCQQTNIASANNVPPCNWPQPGSDEIDITEIKNSNLTTVWQNVISGSSGFQTCTPSTTNVSTNWHIYELDWAPGSLSWKIDGVTTCKFTNSIPTTPMFLMINIAMGGAGGTVNNSTLPQTLSVDYVRVYQSVTASASPCDLNGDGVVDATDVQLAISQALGSSPCTNADLDGTGTCNVVDVQRVINAALGQACRVGQ